MRRRALLGGVAALGSAALAGCSGLLASRSTGGGPLSDGEVPVPEDRPDGVYRPGHVEGMELAGTTERGDFAAAVTYSYAHRFWTVTGESVEKVSIADGDDVHLMAVVWDPETGTVLPETGLSVEVTKGGELVSQEVIYPMLSQPMGFHYGGNFGLAGDGDYTVRLSVGGVSTRRTGAFRGRFGEPTTLSVAVPYSAATRDALDYRRLDGGGTPGAVDPMAMDALPASRAPAPEALPGELVGNAATDDAVLVATALDTPPAGVEGEGRYLAVSARTRYNGYVLPAMGLAATLTRDGATVFDGRLHRTLDPDLGYHYGAVVPAVEPGDELALSVTTQPQTARHEGYETAFGGLAGGMDGVTLTV